MLRCQNIKEVTLRHVCIHSEKVFSRQPKQAAGDTPLQRKILAMFGHLFPPVFTGGEKCLFGPSKGTVPWHWQTHPYSWGFFTGKKKRDTNLNIEMKITNAWDFLNTTTYHPNPPSLLHSLLLPNPHLLNALPPPLLVFFLFFVQSHSFCQTPPSLSRSNCPSHSAVQPLLRCSVDDA